MRVFLVTIGGFGDVLPFVALGKGLKAKGHEVTVCTNSSFEEFVGQNGLTYAYMNDGFAALVKSNLGREAIENMASLWGAARSTVKLARRLGPMHRQTLSDAWAAAKKAEPDVIVFHTKLPAGMHFAEKLRARPIAAALFPQFVPTRAFPSVGFPALALGGWYNKLTYRIVHRLTRVMGGGYIQEWRRAEGLGDAPAGWGLFEETSGEPFPIVHAYSRHLVPIPPDWPPNATVSGSWFLDQQGEWKAPAEIEAFLDAEEAPVYVGFGSMAGRRPERITRIVVAALQEAGVRGILATGWGGLQAGLLPHTIRRIESAPHDWLFPRMAAVVHHGGAGTTAAGLRAGRPTIVCPFFGDQPFWGARVFALGVGSQPIPQKKLTVSNLAQAIQEVTRNPALRKNAEVLGEKIRKENGIANAISIIEGQSVKHMRA